ADHGAYASPRPSPDGRYLYAMRGAVDEPPTPVRLDAREPDQRPSRLRAPGVPVTLPGALTEVTTRADDGQELRAWLALPDGASATGPTPLVVFIHGGPLSSWNAWQWRWNAWIMAAHGYAVLLPDPALSVGYGLDFVRRGWGAWGDRPYTDLMALTDAAVKRDDIDETRTAAMGGSFGGYMANWVAGHTDRFRAIVTHASLWALEDMNATTDEAPYWEREFGDPLKRPERYTANTPHLRVDNIRTPMLVIHGDKDYRVPVGQALRLWWDVFKRGVDAKFLYFPDENHWVLKPGHIKVWYDTVLAFLAHHVQGEEWRRPELL
ncbi:MAG: alpha/beta hydrolase family protein, partial [Streptosporangiaceae bacterium]